MARFLVGFTIVAAVMLAAVTIFTLSQSRPAPPPLPNPNGYDDFVKAADLVGGDLSGYPTLGIEELRARLAKNAEALELARLGLSRECRVPLDYSRTNERVFPILTDFKRLAQALAAQGRLAELEKRPGDAGGCCLDTIRLGQEATRGGIIIWALVGIAVEAIGTAQLERLVPQLGPEDCRKLITALEALDLRREPPENVIQHERDWACRVWGVRGQLVRLLNFRSYAGTEQGFVGSWKAQQARIRRLIVNLAAHAYELEKGERPKNLADLVPAYLKAIPQDPPTATNRALRP